MNFAHYNTNPSEIIRYYEKDGDWYTVEYLDGNVIEYISANKDEEQQLLNTMLKQAAERDHAFNLNELSIDRGYCFAATVAGLLSSLALGKEYPILSGGAMTIGIWGIIKAIRITKDINELKKYRMFFEMIKDIPTNELDESYSKCIEFDNFYCKPININTLDNYSYSSVKKIYKNFNSNQNIVRFK